MNMPNLHRMTPLMYAVQRNNYEITNFLLLNNAAVAI